MDSTGWTPIGFASIKFGPDDFSPAEVGYGVNDPLNLLTLRAAGTQSYDIAAKRELPENTQFLIRFEGSCLGLADWTQNNGRYGWSEHYTTLMPLLTTVIQQMLGAQTSGKNVESSSGRALAAPSLKPPLQTFWLPGEAYGQSAMSSSMRLSAFTAH